MMELLSPLDYPRRAAANLARGGYRLLSGEGDWRDAAGMVPGAAGALATLLNPMLGVGVAAGLHGLGEMTGLVHDAPTTQDVVGLVGGDPESTWQNVAAQIATDPLTYAGAFQGGRAGLRALRAPSPLAQALGEGSSLDGVIALENAQNPAKRYVGLGAPQAYVPDYALPTQAPDFNPYPAAPTEAAYEAALARSRGAGLAPPPPGAFPEMGGPAQEGVEALYAQNRPPAAEVPPVGRRARAIAAEEARLAALLSSYDANAGVLGDAVQDLLGKGYATTAERLPIAQMTDDLLRDADALRRAGPSVQPPPTVREMQALLARNALAEAETAAMNFTPGSVSELAGGDLERLMMASSDQAYGAYGYDTFMPTAPESAYVAPGGGGGFGYARHVPRYATGGAVNLRGVMRRAIPPRPFIFNGVDPEALALALDAGVGEEAAAANRYLAEGQAAEQGRAAYAQTVADARLGSPEVRLAERLSADATALTDAYLSPEETAAAVERVQRYGLPVDARSVLANYRGSAPQQLREALIDVRAAGEALGAPFPNEDVFLGLADAEALRTRGAGALLRLLGPRGMQNLALNEAAALGNVPGTARKTGGHLTRALEEALRRRGLLPEFPAGYGGGAPWA